MWYIMLIFVLTGVLLLGVFSTMMKEKEKMLDKVLKENIILMREIVRLDKAILNRKEWIERLRQI